MSHNPSAEAFVRNLSDVLMTAARDAGVDPVVAQVFLAFGAGLVDEPEPPVPLRRFPATYARPSWRTVSDRS